MLCVISTASAEDTIDENLTATDNEVVVDEKLSVSDGENQLKGDDTITVDCSGGGDYTSISDAVASAGDGKTIFVKNGVYSEGSTITFSKSVSIVGESCDGVRITVGAKSLFSAVEPAMILNFENLTIFNSGTGSNPAFKFTYSAHNVTINNCVFDNCSSKYGPIQLGHSGNTLINNSKFLNSKETTSSVRVLCIFRVLGNL